MSTSTNSNNNWVIGVVLGVSASIMINAGNNMQSLGLKNLKGREEGKPTNRKRGETRFFKPTGTVAPETIPHSSADVYSDKPYKSKIWILGTAIFVIGTMLNFYSYAFAAQSLLASLESVQFVTNLLFGSCMLGSKVTRQMIAGTLLTVVGTILAVQFSSKKAIELSLDDMITLYANPANIAYIIFSFALLVGLGCLYKFHKRLEEANLPQKYTNLVIPWSFSIGSAIIGTQSVVQAKVLAELLALQSKGKERVFCSWFTYITVIVWLTTAAVWLRQLSVALERFDPMFIIPLLQCSFIFFAIISGGIYFKEFDAFSPQQWVGFWGAIGIMFMGLFLVSLRESNKEIALVQTVTDLLLRNHAFTEQERSELGHVLSRNSPPTAPPCHNYENAASMTGNKNPLPDCETARWQNTAAPTTHNGDSVSIKNSISMEALTVAFRSAKILLANHTTLLANAAMLSAEKEAEASSKRRELLSRAQYLLEQRTRESEGFSQQIMEIVGQIKTDLGIPIEATEEIGDLIPNSKD